MLCLLLFSKSRKMAEINRKQTKSTQVLQKLRQDILSGKFAPGEKLQMDDLKKRYGVGYSPLREALSRLSSNGLVEFEEQCGFCVPPLSLEELYDIYNNRMRIETMALEFSMEYGDDAWETEVVACWHRYAKFMKNNDVLDPERWDALEKEFSFTLVKACGSPWLLKMQVMLYENAARYRYLCIGHHNADKKVILDYLQECELLVSAVLARDKIKAIQISRQGWESSLKIMERELKNQEVIKTS